MDDLSITFFTKRISTLAAPLILHTKIKRLASLSNKGTLKNILDLVNFESVSVQENFTSKYLLFLGFFVVNETF